MVEQCPCVAGYALKNISKSTHPNVFNMYLMMKMMMSKLPNMPCIFEPHKNTECISYYSCHCTDQGKDRNSEIIICQDHTATD